MPTHNKSEQDKKYLLWSRSCCDSWSCTGFDTLKEALESEKYTPQWFITPGRVDYEIIEKQQKPAM